MSESHREDSPLINRKKKKKRRGKRKLNEINDIANIYESNNNSNDKNVYEPKLNAKKKQKLFYDNKNKKNTTKGTKLTQSVCCPICIANISILSELEAQNHISNCMAMYQEMKRKQNENTQFSQNISLHEQRRQNKIKHNEIVNEWKNIFKSNNLKTKNDQKQKTIKTILKLPAFKKLKRTNIIINTFNYDNIININNGNCVHFLTHFRDKYYIGITSEWNKPIYCSQITANFLKYMFNLNDNIINPLPINKKILIPDSNPMTFVTLLNANNFMNGSVNLLFQVTNTKNVQIRNNNPDRNKSSIVTINGKKNLSMHNWLVPYDDKQENNNKNAEIIYNDMYCCDFHLNANDINEYKQYNKLKRINIRNLYLDTTYFHPKYKFIYESKLFENVENIIDDLLKNNDEKKICFMFGITFIEKIKLLIYISKSFKQKFSVNKTKKGLLSLLGLTNEDNNCFTAKHMHDKNAQQFQTIALKGITFKNLNKLLGNNEDYERIIGIKLIKPNGSTSNIRKMTKNDITLITIPYSDHCNFEELKYFMRSMDALKIIPTANLKESTKNIAKYA